MSTKQILASQGNKLLDDIFIKDEYVNSFSWNKVQNILNSANKEIDESCNII